MLQPAARTTMGAAAAALYFAVCALFSASLVWTGCGLLPVMPGAEAPVSGAVRRTRAAHRFFSPPEFRKVSVLDSRKHHHSILDPVSGAVRRPRAAHRFFSPPEFREVSVIHYPAEFGKDVPISVPVKGDGVDSWYHHHHNYPQFDKLRGRVEEAKQKHSVGGGGSGLSKQRQDKKKGNKDLLEVLQQILVDQGGQDTEGLHDAISEALKRTEDGEDVDIANLVDQFSEHLKVRRDESKIFRKAVHLSNNECGTPGNDCFDDVDCDQMSEDLERLFNILLRYLREREKEHHGDESPEGPNRTGGNRSRSHRKLRKHRKFSPQKFPDITLGHRRQRAKMDVYPREPSRDEIWAGYKKILSGPPASKTGSYRSRYRSSRYNDGPIPNAPETAGRPEPSSYPLDSAVIELAVMMAHTYRATLKNCHYIQMLVQNFVGVAAGHVTTTTEEPMTIPYGGTDSVETDDYSDEETTKTTKDFGVGIGQGDSVETDDYSDEETTTLMTTTTTTEMAVDIVEFECNTMWKGTLKMQDVNYYETSVSDCSRDAEFWQSETCLSPIKNPDADCTPKRNHGNWVSIHGIKAFNVSHPGTWEFQFDATVDPGRDRKIEVDRIMGSFDKLPRGTHGAGYSRQNLIELATIDQKVHFPHHSAKGLKTAMQTGATGDFRKGDILLFRLAKTTESLHIKLSGRYIRGTGPTIDDQRRRVGMAGDGPTETPPTETPETSPPPTDNTVPEVVFEDETTISEVPGYKEETTGNPGVTEPYDSMENYKDYQTEEEDDDVEEEEDDTDGAPGTQDQSTPWPSVASDHLTMPSVQSDHLTMPPGWKDLSGGASNEVQQNDQHEVVDEEDEEEGAELEDPEEEEPEEQYNYSQYPKEADEGDEEAEEGDEDEEPEEGEQEGGGEGSEVTVDGEEDDDMIKQESAHGGGEVEVLPRSREEPQPKEKEGGEGEGEFGEDEGEVAEGEADESGEWWPQPEAGEPQSEAGEPQPEDGKDEGGGDEEGEGESELIDGGGEGEVEDKAPSWRSGVGLGTSPLDKQDSSFRKLKRPRLRMMKIGTGANKRKQKKRRRKRKKKGKKNKRGQ